jgi:ABC-type transport system involved in multi-copper enzyme maturation permease subunit
MSALTQAGQPAPASGRSRERGGARLADLVWLTWRQHRTVVIAGLAIAAAVTGSTLYVAARITAISQECGNAACPDGAAQAAPLGGSFGLITLAGYLTLAVMLLPLLAGMFLGVPLLAREHEQRTLVLAWSQDVTPQRWLWTKLAVLGAMTAAGGAAVSAASGHLAAVASIATIRQSLFSGNAFLVTGMLPLVQSVVWLAVGVALGAAFRRTLPAIFTALIGYGAAYLLVERVYPSLMTPLTALTPLGSDQGSAAQFGANSLVVENPSATIYDAAGHPVSPALQSLCQSANNLPKDQVNPCLAPQRHLMTLLRYQPGSRIPDFHLILIGGYLGLGAVAAVILWWLVRRTSLSAG